MCVSIIYLMLFFNTHFTMLLDSDDASEMMLAKLLADNGGGILSDNWYYSTELRVLNTQLFRFPFFFFTNNWHAVRMLSTFIMHLALLICVFFFCRANQITYLFPVLGCMVSLPFSEDHFKFILKSYYLPYLSISLIMLSLTMTYGQSMKRSKTKMFTAAIGVIFSFFAGLGGLRQLFVYYMPICAAVLWFWWLKRNPNNHSKNYIIFAFLSAFAAFIGYYVNNHFLRNTFPYETRDIIHYTRIWAETILKVFNGWLINFGYQQDGSIFSFNTIANFYAFFIIVVGVYCVYTIIRNKENYSDENLLTTLFLCSGMIISLLFYSCTDSDYQTRYGYLVSFFMLPVIFIGIGNCPVSFWTGIKKGAAISLIFLLTIVCGINYYKKTEANAENSKNIEMIEIADFLLQNGYENGYSTFWNGNILTELTDGQINVWVLGRDNPVRDIENLTDYFLWLQYKSHLTDHPVGKTYMLFDTDENEKFTICKALPNDHIIYHTGDYVIYGFDTYEELYSLIPS